MASESLPGDWHTECAAGDHQRKAAVHRFSVFSYRTPSTQLFTCILTNKLRRIHDLTHECTLHHLLLYQNPTSLVLIHLLPNNFILAAPRHGASISCSDISSGITTPVARVISGTSSLYASSSKGLDINVCRVSVTFLMSFRLFEL